MLAIAGDESTDRSHRWQDCIAAHSLLPTPPFAAHSLSPTPPPTPPAPHAEIQERRGGRPSLVLGMEWFEVEAAYTFEAKFDVEMSVAKGEALTARYYSENRSWMKAVRPSGERGLVPTSFLKIGKVPPHLCPYSPLM